jgi:integrase
VARALMGLIQDRNGTWCVQRKVPERLQIAVARVLNSGKARQVHLKKSLGTKDLKAANIRATSVIAGFDRTIASAIVLAAQVSAPPLQRQGLNAAEIARMAEALYGKLLADDEAFRFGGRAFVAESVEWIRRNADADFELPYPIESVREYGWKPEQLAQQKEHLVHTLATMQEALALGDITAVQDDVSLLLSDFQISLDRKSASYRELATLALQAYVRALQAIEKRNAGEAVETPRLSRGALSIPAAGGTLSDAFEGWKLARSPTAGTLSEYQRAIDLFIQLHGDLALTAIMKSHARGFREALQKVPRMRKGKLLKAPLPELSAWGRQHPEAQKVSPATVNKQLGAVQAIAGWGNHNGVVPDDTPWSDPFQKMRVEEEQSERAPFISSELQKIFDDPLFTSHKWPEGAQGAAGVWLPLLSLFNGARQAELAGLKVSNVQEDDATRAPLIFIVAERKAGKSLKTKSSERVVPVHPQLVKLGFLKYVAERKRDGADAWLFPLIAPEHGSAKPQRRCAAWSKWWGGYLRGHVGVRDTAKVFHSFRHGFKDALRKASPDEELRDALTGHRGPKSVGRDYGSKEMLSRWGVKLLKKAVEKVAYQDLDLTRVCALQVVRRAPRVRK